MKLMFFLGERKKLFYQLKLFTGQTLFFYGFNCAQYQGSKIKAVWISLGIFIA